MTAKILRREFLALIGSLVASPALAYIHGIIASAPQTLVIALEGQSATPAITITNTNVVQALDVIKAWDNGVTLLGSHNTQSGDILDFGAAFGASPLSVGAHSITMTLTRAGIQGAQSNALSVTV